MTNLFTWTGTNHDCWEVRQPHPTHMHTKIPFVWAESKWWEPSLVLVVNAKASGPDVIIQTCWYQMQMWSRLRSDHIASRTTFTPCVNVFFIRPGYADTDSILMLGDKWELSSVQGRSGWKLATLHPSALVHWRRWRIEGWGEIEINRECVCLTERSRGGWRRKGVPEMDLNHLYAARPSIHRHDTKQSVMGWRRPCVTGYREATGKGQWREDAGWRR